MTDVDKNLRCKAEDVVHNAIIEVARLFHENPFFFINEESFRCMLYTKISQHYTEPVYYKKIPSNEIFLSSPLHANPCIHGISKKDFPDLMLYFIHDNEDAPILTTHRISHSKKTANTKYRRKVWFHPKNIDGDTSANKRIIIELKYNKNFKRLSRKKLEKVKEDIRKTSHWDAARCYIVHFDRSNLLNEDKQASLNDVLSENGGIIDYIYAGYSPNQKGQNIHIQDGMLSTECIM